MNRGSPDRSRLPGPVGIGFNEAPIHESGKFDCYAAVQFAARQLQ